MYIFSSEIGFMILFVLLMCYGFIVFKYTNPLVVDVAAAATVVAKASHLWQIPICRRRSSTRHTSFGMQYNV